MTAAGRANGAARPAVIAATDVGVSPARLGNLLQRISDEVERGTMPSAQVAVARAGHLVAFETLGSAEVDVPVPRYVLQSVGRTLVASAIWRLIGAGQVRPADTVASIIPEFGENGKHAVTVEHLLTHTGGFPYAPLGYPKMADRDQRLAAFARWRLDEPPGHTLRFHLTSAAWLIAEIVQRRSGLTLSQYLRQEIVEPLGLGFGLGITPDEQRATVAPMRCTDGDTAQVDPWGPWYLADPAVVAAGEPAHAAIGSAADVALHYQALLAALGGDTRIWPAGAVADAVRPWVVAVPAGSEAYGGGTRRTAIGLFVVVAGPDPGSGLPTASRRAFGHSGAAYQVGFADPESGLSFAMLSNGYPASGYDFSPRGQAMIADIANLAARLA